MFGDRNASPIAATVNRSALDHLATKFGAGIWAAGRGEPLQRPQTQRLVPSHATIFGTMARKACAQLAPGVSKAPFEPLCKLVPKRSVENGPRMAALPSASALLGGVAGGRWVRPEAPDRVSPY